MSTASASASVRASGNRQPGSEWQKDGLMTCPFDPVEQGQEYHLTESKGTNDLQQLEHFLTTWFLVQQQRLGQTVESP